MKTPSTPSAETVASVLSDWLTEEITAADCGRNAYLKDFEARKPDFDTTFDDPENYYARKAIGHYDHLNGWAEDYRQAGQETDDWATARLIFASLRFTSGSYRQYCLLESTSATEHQQRRVAPINWGVDIESIAKIELGNRFNHQTKPSQRVDNLVARTLAVNDTNYRANQRLFDSSKPKDKDTPIFRSMAASETALAMQKLWLGLAVAQTMVAASFRGSDYSKVPVLEPKSITDVKQVIYPFAHLAAKA